MSGIPGSDSRKNYASISARSQPETRKITGVCQEPCIGTTVRRFRVFAFSRFCRFSFLRIGASGRRLVGTFGRLRLDASRLRRLRVWWRRRLLRASTGVLRSVRAHCQPLLPRFENSGPEHGRRTRGSRTPATIAATGGSRQGREKVSKILCTPDPQTYLDGMEGEFLALHGPVVFFTRRVRSARASRAVWRWSACRAPRSRRRLVE